MNSNHTNTDHFTLDELYKLFGSTWYTDSLNVYCLIPVCVIGVILNLVVFKIIRKEKFRKILIFSFIRVNIINSIFLSLILSTSYLASYRVFDYTNTYESFFFTAHFYPYILSLFYIHSNLMDIFTIIERITNFNKNIYQKKFVQYRNLRLVSLIAVIVINIPNMFICYSTYSDFKINAGTIFRIYYWQSTDFHSSLAGKFIIFSMYILRDIVTLLTKIVLNIVSIRMIRKYFNKIGLQAVLNTRFEEIKRRERLQEHI